MKPGVFLPTGATIPAPVRAAMWGVAVFDHPMNLRHLMPWHVRNYGLLTANPFGHSYYQSGLLKDGAYRLEAGNTRTFRYRICLHLGDATKGRVSDRYHDYVNPPKVEVSN